MQRLSMSFAAALLVLLSSGAYAETSAPAIVSVVPDSAGLTITIQGTNFGRSQRRATLDSIELVVIAYGPDHVVAQLPAAIAPAPTSDWSRFTRCVIRIE